MGPSRWMIRRAVPNGPRVATTVGLLDVAAAADPAVVDDPTDADDLIVVDVAEAAAEEADVAEAEGKRCFQPTSCIAEEVDDPIPDDDDFEAVADTFALIRTVSFLIDLTVSALTLLSPPPTVVR